MMRIIDTHQHLWDLDLFSFSWCRSIPPLNRSFRMADYLEAVRGVNLHGSVHLEADVDEPDMLGETQYIFSLAERDDNPLAGVVAPARPERPDFAASLNLMAGHPQLKGVRRVLHTQPDALLGDPLLRENIGLLASFDLSFDLCVLPRQLPLAIELVERTPQVSFILDHCGNPPIREGALDPWRSHLKRLSELPNVVCKISGLVTNADWEAWRPEDLRPYVVHVIECFGWERVMFGSDWPVCTLAATFQQWLDALLDLTSEAGADEREKLFYDNARTIYRLT